MKTSEKTKIELPEEKKQASVAAITKDQAMKIIKKIIEKRQKKEAVAWYLAQELQKRF